jgi:hypothetical protein
MKSSMRDPAKGCKSTGVRALEFNFALIFPGKTKNLSSDTIDFSYEWIR